MTHREETVNTQHTVPSHLLHFGHHVIIDDVHVRVCHPRQGFYQHLSLLCSETCVQKDSLYEENGPLLIKMVIFFLSSKRAKPFSSKSRTTACVSKNHFLLSEFGALALISYWRSLMEVLSSDIKKEKILNDARTQLFYVAHFISFCFLQVWTFVFYYTSCHFCCWLSWTKPQHDQ